MLTLRPIPIKDALVFNRLVHRRLPKLQGAMWAVSVRMPAGLCGVAIVGRPTAASWDDGTRLQVLRCSVIEGIPNACSMLYGSCSRAARNVGARDLLTYIHDDETGVFLKAAGWIWEEGYETEARNWNRPSRPREETEENGPKFRYWAPWSEYITRKLQK